MTLSLDLVHVPAWPSCYPPAYLLPTRMRLLHPAAYAALVPLAEELTFSDVYRSPDSSLLARREKRGIAIPGRSAHNYGLAVDLDVARCLAGIGCDKRALDERMAGAGWRCWRDDHASGSESWHYTYGALEGGAGGVQQAIDGALGPEWGALDAYSVQSALTALDLYHGALDGELGPLSTEALRAFQRAWRLRQTGRPNSDTMRLLALLTCERRVTMPA